MSGCGFEVHVLSSPGERLDTFGADEGVQVHEVAMQRRITPFRDLISLWRIWLAIRRIRPQIVHAHTPKAGLLGMIAARLAGVPVRIYHIHGLPMMTARGIKRAILRRTERISCGCADRVLCVSRSIRDGVIGEGFCRPDKLKVIRNGSANGVDAARSYDPARFSEEDRRRIRAGFGLPEGAQVLGFVGRLVRDKGLIELSAAWESLKREFPRLHLLIVGRSEPQDPIPSEVLDMLRNDARVHLIGAVDKYAMPGVYSVIDVLAIPTYREGFGNVAIEASAMEVPVVASRVPGIVDAVQEGVSGTLVPPHNSYDLARAVRTYLLDPELRRYHGQSGRIRVLQGFQPIDIWLDLHDEYVHLLRRHELRSVPAPATSPYPTVKRGLDAIVAVALAVVLSPVMIITALAVRVTMGSPVIFRDERPGKGERIFSILKFRTMTDDRDAGGALLPDRMRLTGLGRLLRRTSLDELPQLWNVIKGEMSLIGPRPLRVDYIPYYTKRERRRHDVRPGITGLAQVSGRNVLPWDERLEMDVSYVERRSLMLDLQLAALTALKVMRRSGVVDAPGQVLPPLSVCRRETPQIRAVGGSGR
jgi:lipopolysaccharide/colanic/teichoic acid biosynthesis glycosyltransferase